MTTDGNGRPPPNSAPPSNSAPPPNSAPPSNSAPHPENAAPSQSAPILDQAFDAGSLYALRATVAAHATEAGLAPGRADDLIIAVHELAANAVRHGAGHGRLRIWRSDQALLCEISDDGLPEPQKPPEPQQPAAHPPEPQKPPESQKPAAKPPEPHKPQDAPQWRTEPGHGLSLVRQVADHTSLRSGRNGTSATISFALAASGPPFRLAQHDTDGCTVLAVTGPLDVDSAAQLNQAIEHLISETPALKLVLDLTNLTGWDSAGLAALITAQQQISATPNARMILAGLPAHLEQHLRQAHLTDRFTLADSQTQAAKTISEA
jgi:anti-anti-sigma factor